LREIVNGLMSDVYPEHGLPLAGDPKRPAAMLDTGRVFRSVELGMAHSSASITRSMSNVANEPSARLFRTPRSSTARARKRRKEGRCIDPHGYDAGKIKGKKRHILVDTQGFLMHAIVDAADIQSRDGGVPVVGHPDIASDAQV
jgi:hypothetical protein